MATLLGNLAVAVVGQLLYTAFAPKPPDIEGPRLDDLNVPSINPGNPINRVWGTMKVPGQMIWTSGLKETKHTKNVKGGKGGSKSQKQITYTYSTNVAIAVADGQVENIRRIYAGPKLIYENLSGNSSLSLDDQRTAYQNERTTYWTNVLSTNPNLTNTSAIISEKVAADLAAWDEAHDYGTEVKSRYEKLKIYKGIETQTPDPTMEEHLGVGNIPAYRGITYFVITELQLADFGNAIPAFTVELEADIGEVAVSKIIDDLMAEAGMVKNVDYATAPELDSMTVQGFALSRLTGVREAVQLLQSTHPFDGVEFGSLIYFRGRDRNATGAVAWSDMRAHGKDKKVTKRLTRERTDDLQLPRQIKFGFQDPLRNYSKNQVFAVRQFSQSNQVSTVDLPVSATPSVMKKAAEAAMVTAIASRNTYSFTLPAKYLRFAPGDILRIPLNEAGDLKQVRITQFDIGANFLIDVKAMDHLGTEPTVRAVADETGAPAPVLSVSGRLLSEVMDIPSLTDEDLTTGAYVAFGSEQSVWSGAALYRDTQSGSITPLFNGDAGGAAQTSWEQEVYGSVASYIGLADNALPPASPYIVDRENRLVALFNTPGAYWASQTFEQAVNGTDNVFLVGNEIVQALTVQAVGDGVFIFSDLLRGLRGTEWAIYTHQALERVVHISDEAITRWTLQDTLIDKPVDYRTVKTGGDVLAETTRTITFTAAHKKALAPDIETKSRAGDGALSLTLVPRARYGGIWLNGVGTLSTEGDAASEQFIVEVWNGPAYQSGNSMLRSATLVGTRDWTYTAAEQVADFGSVQSAVHLRIVQIGADGRNGFPRYALV